MKPCDRLIETVLQRQNVWVGTAALSPNRALPLQRGGSLPAGALRVKFAAFGDPSLPVVLLCPSMSNTPFPVHTPELSETGWWPYVVGYGPGFGIDLRRFRVLVPSPLGSPYGSTSPLQKSPFGAEPWGPDFPVITPSDMADAHALLLDALGVARVHAVVGGSMGGMQALQFAVKHPERCGICAAVASTGRTSPATVALRSVQRTAIRMDPSFSEGRYDHTDVRGSGPVQGMSLARQFGTICYRSRLEFDARFEWQSDEHAKFEVERYLETQAKKFVGHQEVRPPYDPNCYLALSKAMDLMDLSAGHGSMEEAVRGFQGDVMLLPFSTDVLMPPEESRAVARAFVDARRGSSSSANGHASVHCETLESNKGHDAFLVGAEAPALNSRLSAFLEGGARSAREIYERSVRDVDPGL